MLGAYDFCGHYEWTFEWLRNQGGEPMVRQYWEESISQDAATHAAELILKKGTAGMKEYWGHTFQEEGAGYHTLASEHTFRIDMHEYPSKGFLIRNNLEQYHDYCDHCMGWVGPVMKRAGYVVDHQHSHCGRCWWEIRKTVDPNNASEPGQLAGEKDVRLQEDWRLSRKPIDTYTRTNAPEDKRVTSGEISIRPGWSNSGWPQRSKA